MDDHCYSEALEGLPRPEGRRGRSREVEGELPSLACLPYRTGYRWNTEHTPRKQQWSRAEDVGEEERIRMKEKQGKIYFNTGASLKKEKKAGHSSSCL